MYFQLAAKVANAVDMDNRSVKTNITLPAWLKELAEKQGVNFSQITQAAIKEYLGVDRP